MVLLVFLVNNDKSNNIDSLTNERNPIPPTAVNKKMKMING